MQFSGSRIVLSAVCSLVALAVCAQTAPPEKKDSPPPNPCPQLVLNAPNGQIVKEGEAVPISANLSGGDATASPNFVWTTSTGLVSSGQGTRNVTIDSTGAGADRQMKIDLWVSGFPPECSLQAAAMINVVPPASKVMEFGELDPEREAERLKTFTDSLPAMNDNIYVFGYAGRNSVRGFSNASLRRIKAQLVANGIRYERLGFIDGGYRESAAFEIWMVPVGADIPRSKPTIAAKDIVFPKPPAPPAKKP